MKKGFFAYGSDPSYCGEFIEEAVLNLNTSLKGIMNLETWKSNNVTGQLIITKIVEKIKASDFVCADLTNVNNNVLFELGYAIAISKPVWLIIDKSNIESNRKFNELNFFSTIGYQSYTNSADIISSFLADKPYENPVSLSETLFKNVSFGQKKKAILYLKSQVDTNYNQEIVNEISEHKLPMIIDDPSESKIQSLSWYIDQVTNVPAVLVEFSSYYRVGFELHNSKCSFVSGLALGLDLELLMISEKPFPVPIDYKELFKKFTSRKMCIDIVRPFLNKVRDNIAVLLLKKINKEEAKRAKSNLQRLNFGEYIAEHENDDLANYYVEPSHYRNLVKGEYNIIIGRKGTGKTATFYYLNETLSSDVRNHVVMLKPISFEIDGLVKLMTNLKDDFEKGYIIESIWKFIIYTEIANSFYHKIKDKRDFAKSDSEKQFLEYVDENKSIILTDFSTRLEQQIELLLSVEKTTQKVFKTNVSEILHQGILYKLRDLISKIIRKGGKLVVLIDNLDKSWKKTSDIKTLSKYILGLLGVVGRVARDFRGRPQDDLKFTFHLTLFLRSDIFKYVITQAREPDKIEYTRLTYSDPEVFFRIIEERFVELSEIEVERDELFSKYICAEVNGQDVKRFIINNVFPRPRDIIYFFNAAKNIAILRGHTQISEADIIKAYEEYSNWIFKSILVENGITITQMRDFMYNLMGESHILEYSKIVDFAIDAQIEIKNQEQQMKFIDHLVSLSVLGREVKKSKFKFEYDFESNEKLKALANKLGTKNYMIHNALASYLECD